MTLKVSSNSTGVWITWEMPDESMSATFRIKTKSSDQEILKTLVKATTFIASQMNLVDQEIAELESAIRGSGASGTFGPTTDSTSSAHQTQAATQGASSTPSVPSGERIVMTPAALSDRPSDGGPVSPNFGWSSMPTTSVPKNLTTEQGGGWEMIPPGEM